MRGLDCPLAPLDLLDQAGIGPIVAAVVLCGWSHPGRLHSEAAVAVLTGVAPIPATSRRVKQEDQCLK